MSTVVADATKSTAEPDFNVQENLTLPPSVPISPDKDNAVTTQSLNAKSALVPKADLMITDNNVPACDDEPEPTV